MNKFIIVLIFGVLLTGSACNKDAKEEPYQPMVLNPNTIVVTESTNNSLVAVTQNQLIFSTTVGQIEEFTTNKILASGISSNAPNGYLRKVTSVTYSNGGTVLNTVNVTLEDAIAECDISVARPFTIDDVYKKDALSFGSTLDIIFDADNNYSTINDQVQLQGNYSVEPELLFALKIKNFKIQHLKVGCTVKEELSATIAAPLINSSFSQEQELFNYPLQPFTFVVFGFPVVITPEFTTKIGLQAVLSGSVQAGVSANCTQQAYGEYIRDIGWNTYSEKDFTPVSTSSTLSGTINAKTYLKPELSFQLYDINTIETSIGAEAYVSTQGTCEVSSSGNGQCGWNIKAGVSANANIQAGMFGFSLINYNAQLFDFSKVIYESGNANNYITFSLSNAFAEFTDINNCAIDDGLSNGSSNKFYFDVPPTIFDIDQYFEIRCKCDFSNGSSTVIYANSENSSVVRLSNSRIMVSLCTRFGETEYVDNEIKIYNDTYLSNPLTVRLYRPEGANKTESAGPPNVSVQ